MDEEQLWEWYNNYQLKEIVEFCFNHIHFEGLGVWVDNVMFDKVKFIDVRI